MLLDKISFGVNEASMDSRLYELCERNTYPSLLVI